MLIEDGTDRQTSADKFLGIGGPAPGQRCYYLGLWDFLHFREYYWNGYQMVSMNVDDGMMNGVLIRVLDLRIK